MGWASKYIESLQKGETVSFRPRGNSMEPLIKSGQLCTVIPVRGAVAAVIDKGDVVLCKVHGREYLHKVLAIKPHGVIDFFTFSPTPNDKHEFQIGNNKGHINGWVKGTHIYGKLIEVEP